MQEDKTRIEALERQVEMLMRFMNEKKKNQLSYPLDYASQQILQTGVPIVIGGLVPGAIATGTGYFPVRVNNKIINVMYT